MVDSSIAVHRELGPGLLESVYEECLTFELLSRGFAAQRQVAVPLSYRGRKLEAVFRIDVVVDSLVAVEIKAVDREHPLHTAQLLSYLRLSGLKLGLLINFNVPLLKNGIRRLVSTP